MKKQTGEAKTVMAKTISAETGCSSWPRGEKRPQTAVVSGGQAAHSAPPCDLCASWGQPTHPLSTHHSSRVTPHGLRIALVDNDTGTCLVAGQMVQAQRDGWTLEVYHPPCLAREPAGGKGSPRPSALDGDQGSRSPPDVVLIGLSGREDARLACVRKMKALAPDLPVLIISGDSDQASIVERCAAGADGYLLKPLAPGELACAVSALAQGLPALCPEAQKAIVSVLHQAITATTAWIPALSGREQEVLGCLLAGWSDKEIAERLGMTPSTVHVHLVQIYRRLDVHTRQQAVAKLLGVWRGGEGGGE